MNKNILSAFNQELIKISEEDISWQDKMLGIFNAVKEDPIKNILRQTMGTLGGGLLGSIGGTGLGMAITALSKGRLPIETIMKSSNIGGTTGATIGGYIALRNILKEKGIEPNLFINPKFSDNSISKYILNKGVSNE